MAKFFWSVRNKQEIETKWIGWVLITKTKPSRNKFRKEVKNIEKNQRKKRKVKK